MTVREGRKAVWFPPQGPEEVPGSREQELSWQSLNVERFRVPFARKAAPPNAHASVRWQLPPDAVAACNAPQAEAPAADEVCMPIDTQRCFSVLLAHVQCCPHYYSTPKHSR